MEEPDFLTNASTDGVVNSGNEINLTLDTGIEPQEPNQAQTMDTEIKIDHKPSGEGVSQTLITTENGNAVTLTIGGIVSAESTQCESLPEVEDNYQHDSSVLDKYDNVGSEIKTTDYGNPVTITINKGGHADANNPPLMAAAADMINIDGELNVPSMTNETAVTPTTHSTTLVIGDLTASKQNMADNTLLDLDSEDHEEQQNMGEDFAPADKTAVHATNSISSLSTSEDAVSLTLMPDYSREISNSSLVTRGISEEDLLGTAGDSTLTGTEGFGGDVHEANDTLVEEIVAGDANTIGESTTLEIQISKSPERQPAFGEVEAEGDNAIPKSFSNIQQTQPHAEGSTEVIISNDIPPTENQQIDPFHIATNDSLNSSDAHQLGFEDNFIPDDERVSTSTGQDTGETQSAVNMMDDFVTKAMMDFGAPKSNASTDEGAVEDNYQSFTSTFEVNTSLTSRDNDEPQTGSEQTLNVSDIASLEFQPTSSGLVTELTVEPDTHLNDEPLRDKNSIENLGSTNKIGINESIGEEEATFQSMDELEKTLLDDELLPALGGLSEDYKHAPKAAQEEYVSDSDSISSETQVSMNLNSDFETSDTNQEGIATDFNTEPQQHPIGKEPIDNRPNSNNSIDHAQQAEFSTDSKSINPPLVDLTRPTADIDILPELEADDVKGPEGFDFKDGDAEFNPMDRSEHAMIFDIPSTFQVEDIGPSTYDLHSETMGSSDGHEESLSVPVSLPTIGLDVSNMSDSTEATSTHHLEQAMDTDSSAVLSHSPMDHQGDDKEVSMDHNTEEIILPAVVDIQSSSPQPMTMDDSNLEMKMAANMEESSDDVNMEEEAVNTAEIDQAFEFLDETQKTQVTAGIFVPQTDVGMTPKPFGDEEQQKPTFTESGLTYVGEGLSLADELQQALNPETEGDSIPDPQAATNPIHMSRAPDSSEQSNDIQNFDDALASRKSELAINFAPLRGEDDESNQFRGLESWNSQEELTIGSEDNTLSSDQAGLSLNISGFKKEDHLVDSSDEEQMDSLVEADANDLVQASATIGAIESPESEGKHEAVDTIVPTKQTNLESDPTFVHIDQGGSVGNLKSEAVTAKNELLYALDLHPTDVYGDNAAELESFAANQSITETSTESAEHASEPNVPDDTACPNNDPNNTEVPITQLGYASVLSDEQLTEQSPEPQARGLTDEQNGGSRQSDDEGVDRNRDASHPTESECVGQSDNHSDINESELDLARIQIQEAEQNFSVVEEPIGRTDMVQHEATPAYSSDPVPGQSDPEHMAESDNTGAPPSVSYIEAESDSSYGQDLINEIPPATQPIIEEIVTDSSAQSLESTPLPTGHVDSESFYENQHESKDSNFASSVVNNLPSAGQPFTEEVLANSSVQPLESDPQHNTQSTEQDSSNTNMANNDDEVQVPPSDRTVEDEECIRESTSGNIGADNKIATDFDATEKMHAMESASQETDAPDGTSEGFVMVPATDTPSEAGVDSGTEQGDRPMKQLDITVAAEDSPMHTSNTTNDSIDNIAEDLDGVHTPTVESRELDLDSSLIDAMHESPTVEPLPELTAREELHEQRSKKEVTIDNQTVTLDMNIISEYKAVYSHGGYTDPEYKQAIIVLSACEFPDRSNPNYHNIMDQLFLYVYHSIQQLVVEEYVIIYYQGGAAKSQLPGLKWMKRCHDRLSHSVRKSIKKLFIVHPTFWTRTVLFWSKPFISAKFVSKVKLAYTLEEVNKVLPMQNVPIPDKVRMYDLNLVR